jgi:hypothetical protein
MIFLTCTKINIPELELTPLTKDILKAISIQNDRYIHEENNEEFISSNYYNSTILSMCIKKHSR